MGKHNKLSQLAAVVFSALLLVFSCNTSVSAATVYDCESGVHAYEVKIEKEAEEDIDGLRRYTCTICGESYEEVIPMYGHVYGEWEVEEEPTCQETGLQSRICIQHNHEEEVRQIEEIAVADHQYESDVQDVTCTEEGIVTYTCIWCVDTYTEKSEALGHKYGEWITEEKATVFSDGLRYRVCSHNSEHREEEVIPRMIEDINVADVVLAGANVSAVWVFGVSIARDVAVLNWHKRKIRAISKISRLKGGRRL